MKVYLAHYWESDEVVMTKAFAGLPTGEEVRALWVARYGSHEGDEFRFREEEGGRWYVDVFRDGEEDEDFYVEVILDEVHPTASAEVTGVGGLIKSAFLGPSGLGPQ